MTERVRVSLREIRENTFRALSAHGASHGEASTAARMVVDAELQGQWGIRYVLIDLARDSWPVGGVSIRETSVGPVVLGDAADNRLLRHLPLAAHLAAAEPKRFVFVPGEMTGVACLDTVLLEAAEATQRAVALVDTSQRPDPVCRVALPNGSLGTGAHPELGERVRQEAHVLDDDERTNGGVWLFALGEAPKAPDFTWVSAAQRTAGRADVASEGRLITATPWWELYGAARRYLVG